MVRRATTDKEATRYRKHINCNHVPHVQFVTLAHELGHLFLGHLGMDRKLGIPERSGLTHAQQELEAESVAYLVCKRNGVTSKSETYLANYVEKNITVDHIDFYRVMRAAGQVEDILGINAQSKYGKASA